MLVYVNGPWEFAILGDNPNQRNAGAGEAIDKVARQMKLPGLVGSCGGKVMEDLARKWLIANPSSEIFQFRQPHGAGTAIDHRMM